MTRGTLWFVVESGTDVRLVEGLAAHYALRVLARRIEGGVEISQPPDRPVDVRTGPASRPGFARLVYAALSRAAATDRVLVQGYGPAALAANLAARRTGAATSMLVCSPVERYYRQRRDHPEPGKRYRRAEAIGLWLFARLNALAGRHYVVLSRHLADVVRAHGTRASVDVVPVYGVDTDVFRPPDPGDPPAARRQRLSLPPQGTLLFFSSRVAPEKDAATLLHAVSRLTRAGRDVRVLHRSGGFRTFLALATRVGVADRVLAGDAVHPLRDLPRWYQAADLVVQASREEGLGFSPLEALACGTPVIASAVGGLRETILDGETGWTYPPGDAAALAARVAAVLADPAEARRRAARGREMVREHFERRAVFDRLAAVLEQRGTP